MHAPVSTSDVDVWRHFETRQAHWEVERRHMQMQLQRQRQQKERKERSQKADVAFRSKRVATDWKREDDVIATHERTQVARGSKEAEIRDADDALQQASSSLQSDGETKLHLGNREAVERYDQTTDDQYERRGSRHWAATMRAGEEEFAFEFAESRRARSEACRGFKWSKADEMAENALSRTVERQLQTGPGGREHLQTPGPWRADLQNMDPGAWRNRPRGAETERAKTAQTFAHARAVRDYDSRRGRVTSTLDNWGNVQERVADARFGAWRTKVDAQRSPRTPSWPDKRTHRMGPPVKNAVLAKSPRGELSPRHRAK